MGQEKKRISIIWIVLSFVLFLLPLGVLLIGLRLMQNKKELIKGGRIMLAIAVILFAFFMLFSLVSYGGADDVIFSFYLFGIGAIIAFVFAFLLVKKGNKYQKYFASVTNHGIVQLSALADTMKMSKDAIIQDLQQMIADGIFPEAKLDVQEGIFVVENHLIITVKCDNCGASVSGVLGTNAVCEYCQSPVSFP